MEPARLPPCDDPPGGRAWGLAAEDGVRLRAAVWPKPAGWAGTVLILPGRTEHIEKYGIVARALALRGWGAVTFDWRGQGLADRLQPDRLRGDVAAFADYQKDLRAVLALAAAQGLGPMPWLAHSMGGAIALAGLVAGLRPPAVAFSAPMWGLRATPAMKTAIGALGRAAAPLGWDRGYTPTTGPTYGLSSMPFDLNSLTRDRAMFDRMRGLWDADPRLALGGPTLRWTAGALAETARLARAPSPPVRALIAVGGAEKIVDADAIRARAARWPGVDVVEFPGAEHELLMELPAVREALLDRADALFRG